MRGDSKRYHHFATIGIFFLVSGLCAQQTPDTKEFDLTGDQIWFDTSIDVQPGDSLHISATGTLQFAQSSANGPEGLARGWKDLLRVLPVNEAGRGALLVRIGDKETSRIYRVGASADVQVVSKGKLFLGLNRKNDDTPTGSYHVTVALTHTAAKAVAPDVPLPRLTQTILDQIPKRIGDTQGNPGDRVNFLLLGSEETMQKAFETAGWVKVDPSVKDAVLHGLLVSLSKQAYLTMPMSELYLFGRPQDYGFAHAVPLAVVASRHHLRLWKAPFQVDGQTLWVGAGTHDVGFERDQRNGGVTHKIDPEVDKEREYIADSLQETGLIAKADYMTVTDPIKEAKTATGGGFKSDGRTLVLMLLPDSKPQSPSASTGN